MVDQNFNTSMEIFIIVFKIIFKGIAAQISCARIVGSDCDGNTFFLSLTAQPTDPFACFGSGVSRLNVLSGYLQVSGNCPSKCILKRGIVRYNPSYDINGCNSGYNDIIDVDIEDDKNKKL